MTLYRSSLVPSVLLLGLALLGPSCKGDDGIPVSQYVDEFTEQVCTSVIACNCEYPYDALLEHCISQLSVGGETLAELNSVDGLSFDGECADKAIATIKELGCTNPVFDPNAVCEQPCKIWYGPMSRGGTCTTINGNDNCVQGLVCSGQVCVDPCAEPNLPNIGEACAPDFGCDEGAYCDAQTAPLTPTCVSLPNVGQPCLENQFGGLLCNTDLVCDQVTDPASPICVALPRLGEECPNFECADDLFCDGSAAPPVCAAFPTLGEDCPFGLCESPYACQDSVCIEQPPIVCGYYGGLPPDENNDTTGDTTDTTDTTDTGACVGDDFECGTGECVPATWVCDGVTDCPDGSDEIAC